MTACQKFVQTDRRASTFGYTFATSKWLSLPDNSSNPPLVFNFSLAKLSLKMTQLDPVHAYGFCRQRCISRARIMTRFRLLFFALSTIAVSRELTVEGRVLYKMSWTPQPQKQREWNLDPFLRPSHSQPLFLSQIGCRRPVSAC